MATPLSTIVARARLTLVETTASFWSDDELLAHAVKGCQDLWKAIIDVYQDHFLIIDALNVSFPAGALAATGVPAGCFRIKFIEPRQPGQFNNAIFFPKDYSHPDFAAARAASALTDGNGFYYDLVGAGPPVAAPTLYIAPRSTAPIALTIGYIATVNAAMTAADVNPIPGETDHAIEAWVIAWARAKEREDRSPDAEWLAIYGNEKQGIITAITPRQEDEPDYVEGMFEGE